MIKNYFLVAWRNLVHNKAFSAINILGLALGMTCSLLILLWVHDERSVDGFHANGPKVTNSEYSGGLKSRSTQQLTSLRPHHHCS